jgi:hypothetical protein
MMSVQMDTLYLPVPAPIKVQVYASSTSSRQHNQRHNGILIRPQTVYRLPPHRQVEGISYGPDALMDMQGMTGRIIDLYV